MARAPRIGVGVVCLRDDDVLLVRRGKPPFLGQWSIPGGGLEPGETTREAALRELHEETGVTARLIGLLDVIDILGYSAAEDRDGADGQMVLIDFAAVWTLGEPKAGDDALDARFFSQDDATAAVRWSETRRVIKAAFALPR